MGTTVSSLRCKYSHFVEWSWKPFEIIQTLILIHKLIQIHSVFTHDELLLFTLFDANFVAVTLLAMIANSAVQSSTPTLIHNAIDTSTTLIR